jgi:hypothetical protein
MIGDDNRMAIRNILEADCLSRDTAQDEDKSGGIRRQSVAEFREWHENSCDKR